MNIEIASAQFPAGVGPVVVTVSGVTRIVAILDGTGSWEPAMKRHNPWRPFFARCGQRMPDGVSLVSCGSYTILHVQETVTDVLYRPLFWIDDQVDVGAFTETEARSHPFRHVYIGPLVSRGAATLFSDTGPIRAGRVVIATMELARTLLHTPAQMWSHGSAETLQNLEHDGAAHRSPVVIIDPGAT